MITTDDRVKVYVNGLLLHPFVQKLKLVDDKGINVSTHTYDVLRLAVKKVKNMYNGDLDEAAEELDLFAILVGVIIHDTTKGTLRLSESHLSHSIIMKKKPEIVKEEARLLLKDVSNFTKLKLKKEVHEHILHIVVSHHGKWGKIKPNSKEASIVHEADKYSAMYHRITPIGAKKIVKLMSEGFTKEDIGKITGHTIGVIEDRLKRSKKQLRIKTNRELLSYYLKRGTIPNGDEFFSRRIKETERIIKKVDTMGFEDLVMKSIIIDYIDDDEVFE